MLFTSLQFVLFLALTMVVFYLLRGRGQRLSLLLANYIFYMWWEPRFGLLLLAGSAVTYTSARAIQARLGGRRRLWLALGVAVMLGQLILFKYGDFFLSGAAFLVGAETPPSLGLLLPVGISFYSFAAAGYLFDVYRGKLEAERNFLDFALFLSFSPPSCPAPSHGPGSFSLSSRFGTSRTSLASAVGCCALYGVR